MKGVRLYYATDVHGSETCFKKFLNAGKLYKADVIIMGGDITGKTVTPIFESNNGYRCRLLGETVHAQGEKALRELEEKIRSIGSYPMVTDEEEYKIFQENGEKRLALFESIITANLRRWVEMADERLSSTDIECYISPGNDDIPAIDKVLEKAERIVNPNEKIVMVKGRHEMLSLGYSNITPWMCPRDVTEETLRDKLNRLAVEVQNPKLSIYNIHVPPYGTGLDEAPELDEQLRPKLEPGKGVKTKPVGSQAVRESLANQQPLLGLHGHIHESRGFARIGRTLCLNPGSEYQEGVLKGALIQVSEDRIRDFLFTTG
ncbi:MAG: metallophosphoesterase [Candidatus Bathyarchaeia archaeon]